MRRLLLPLLAAFSIAGCSSAPEPPSAASAKKAGGDAAGTASRPTASGKAEAGVTTVHLGYFPNITHAQPLLGVPRGDYQKAFGDKAKLETLTFNAGPSVIEGIFAGRLDIAYVGPSPTINGFLKSKGEEVRVIAGAASNGILVIGNKKRGITSLEQLKGKKVATPQLGNTQDISARYYVTHDLKATLKDKGGDTEIMPINNPDIEIAFEKDQIDAAWVPEPWGSRIIARGLATLIAEEKDLWPAKTFNLTNVIARRAFLDEHPDLVAKFLEAHVALTAELQKDPQGKAEALNAELKRLTTKELPKDVIAKSLKYTQFTTDPALDSFTSFFEKGKALGLLKGDSLDSGKLFALEPLKKAESGTGPSASSETSGTKH